MPFSSKNFGLLAKVETTYGTDSVPVAGTDGVRLTEPPNPNETFLAQNLRDTWATGGLGSLAPAAASGKEMRYPFSTVIHGAGSAYSATNLPVPDPFFKAVGFSATVVTTPGAETVTYDPSDSVGTGMSSYVFQNNKRYIALGSLPQNMQFDVNAGEFPLLTGEVAGFSGGITELALPTITYPTTPIPVFKDSAMTIGGTTLVIRGFTVDFGAGVATRGDGNATDAHAGFRIVNRTPTLTVRVEVEALATYDPWGDQENETLRALSFQFFDPTQANYAASQYNRYTVTAADMRVQGVTAQDFDGISGLEVTYGVHTPSTGNEFRFLFD